MQILLRDTIDKIIETARVEEVVGEFVTLKKRGVNLIGLCPFHGEKTPSFTVSPVKGIYKCFGCGKAGNPVGFVMDHLSLTFTEALKWLAGKYGIEVNEREISPEERELQTERESMLIVMQYSQRYLSDTMFNTDEGKSVGLGYFRERGLREDIISRFQLGYSPAEKNAYTIAAVKAGYQPKYLAKTGMSIISNRHVEGNELTVSDLFDRYAGRVMFPIHDNGGRVVAFGGRTLSTDKKTAKYINSPETEIYHKSNILYGLWLGKKAIQEKDLCYLVEGYMDVIAMHQAGIENVVASSGTSLTVSQVKSIHRFTHNVVVLYDGDEAGQKASNRAIPLLLEEGMNVKLLMFPDNHDPDSFSRKVSREEFHNYLADQPIDFLYFKAKKLKDETKNDPIKRAGVIRDIVDNIALIPDNIIRSIYIKECSGILEIEENVLQGEVNKLRRKGNSQFKRKDEEANTAATTGTETLPTKTAERDAEPENTTAFIFDAEEKELLRIIVNYGNLLVSIDAEDEDNEKHLVEITLAEFIMFELWRDEVSFENPLHQTVLDEYVTEISQQRIPDIQYFIQSPNPIVNTFAIHNIINKHELHKWSKVNIHVDSEISNIKRAAQNVLFSLKEKKLRLFIDEKQEHLKTCTEEESVELLKEIMHLAVLKKRVNGLLGRVVVK